MTRFEVVKFSEDMEAALARNDHKPGWHNNSLMALFYRLLEEAQELREVLESGGVVEPRLVIGECADVANFAMMIADNVRESRE